MSYARYKFNKAVRSLSEAGTRRREWLASDHAFRLLRLTPTDVPIALQQEFQMFQHEMKPILRASETGFRQFAAFRAVDEETVGRIIDRIMYMHQVIESDGDKKQVIRQS